MWQDSAGCLKCLSKNKTLKLFFIVYFYFMCFICMYVCAPPIYIACGDQARVLEFPEAGGTDSCELSHGN